MVRDDERETSGASASAGPLEWWWWVSGPAAPAPCAGFDERERYGRGRLVSSALLCYSIVALALFPLAIHIPLILVSELVIVVGESTAVWLNHSGRVEAAGFLLIVSANAALVVGMQGGAGHLFDVSFLPGLDLFIIPTLIAAVALPPRWVFPVAGANSAVVAALMLFQPRTPALQQLMTEQWYLVASRPICLQFIVAAIAYLWVRGTLRAIRRADLAEEVAELRQREAERNQELADGVRQLLETHVQVANGHLHARAPIIRGSLLFPLSASLNTLIARLAAAEGRERQVEAQAQALCDALAARERSEWFEWPALRGTHLDPIIAVLRNGSAVPQPQPGTRTMRRAGGAQTIVLRAQQATTPLATLESDTTLDDRRVGVFDEG